MTLMNVGLFSLQAGVLILAGLGLVWVLRLRRPLGLLQVLLLAVVLLPVLQPWSRPVVRVERVAPGRVAMPATALVRADGGGRAVDWSYWAMLVLAGGVCCRLGWLGIGLWRLRGLRRDAEFVGDVGVSTEIAGPVTFGVWRPVILVPPAVMEMGEAAREAVLAHERIHVRRRDWVFAVVEELVLCGLWFHPLVWWLVGRIRLVREQVVDFEAARELGSRDAYLEALLTVADVRLQPYFAPAPPFLRRRELASRIRLLLVEEPMTRVRLISSYVGALVALAGLGVMVTGSFPLRGAPQVVEAGADFTAQGVEAVLTRQPVYPMAARRAGVEGSVVVEVTVAGNGEVADARVVSGAQELRKAALDAVLQWQFKPGPAVGQVTLQMRAPAERGESTRVRVVAVEIDPSIGEPLAGALRARLQPFVGQGETSEIPEIVRRLGARLTTRMRVNRVGDVTEITHVVERTDGVWGVGPAAPNRVKVGGVVQAANLVTKVDPVYPPLAKQARIQGTVRFEIGIGKDGGVVALQVVSGHPLLIPAAAEALRQYRYRPTMLNGQPVEVATQVDVNFSL